MIRFTVVWHKDAQDRLAELWMEAADRAAVSQAANAIDAYLKTDAYLKGYRSTAVCSHRPNHRFPFCLQ